MASKKIQNFKGLKFLPLEQDAVYLIEGHNIYFAKEGGSLPSGTVVKKTGFYRDPFNVKAWKITKRGFFFPKEERELIQSLDLIGIARCGTIGPETKPEDLNFIVAEAEDDFGLEERNIINHFGGKRIVLRISYVNQDSFEVEYSRVVRGHELDHFKHDYDYIDSREASIAKTRREEFINSLGMDRSSTFPMFHFGKISDKENAA